MGMDKDEFDKCKSTNRLLYHFQKRQYKGGDQIAHRLPCSGRVLHDNLAMFV